MSHRIAQIESMLKRAISTILQQRLSDPRVVGMVSVTRVKISPDLHDAFVYISVMPREQQKKTVYGLRHAAGHVYSKVCEMVELKKVPHLDFREDDTLKMGADVIAAIDRGRRKDRAIRRSSSGEGEVSGSHGGGVSQEADLS